MIIKRSPVFSEGTLTVSRSGDILTLNGVSFDFTDLAEGDILPADAVNSPFVTSDVTRRDGEINATIRWPHAIVADEADRFPEPLTPETGDVGETGVIDWTQRTSQTERTEAALTEWREGKALPRSEFAERAAEAGVITWKEAADWTSGNSLPAVAQSYIDTLPTAEQDKVSFVLLARSNIRRNSPEIAEIQNLLTLTDEQVDDLFS